MVLLEQLRIHVGGLILLKSELWWYGARAWDGARGRICLLMDAAPTAASARRWPAAVTGSACAAATLLLIDGRPHWVWVSADDLELL